MSFLLLSLFIISTGVSAADCVAHRGYNISGVENSLNSVLNAVYHNADGIEIDIRHSKDGVPFLLHDSRLKRVVDRRHSSCRSETRVNELTWTEIKENCILDDGQSISSLSELLAELEYYPGKLFIELKDKPSRKFAEVIANSRFPTERMRVISFRLKFLQVVRDLFPEIESLRLSKFIPFLAWTRGMNVHFPLNPFSILARWLGYENGVWTVNDLKRLRKYHKRNIDYITTDELELCLEAKK